MSWVSTRRVSVGWLSVAISGGSAALDRAGAVPVADRCHRRAGLCGGKQSGWDLEEGRSRSQSWAWRTLLLPVVRGSRAAQSTDLFQVGSGSAESMPTRPTAVLFVPPNNHADGACVSDRHQLPARPAIPKPPLGFIEASSSWAPFLLYHMRRVLAKGATRSMTGSEYR
jgi:hypothetical protein